MQLVWRVFLVILILSLTVGDIITSHIIFSAGLGYEGNPIIRNMMFAFGDLWWVPKLLGAIVLSVMAFDMWNGKKIKKKWQVPIIRLLIGIYIFSYTALLAHHFTMLYTFQQLSEICD